MSKAGIVNVRMVITEEKILSNIDKVNKLINPNNKKQLVELGDDSYFKDLIESIKTYLIEYPKKKNFPISVYKAAYGLVEYATNQFEENTKKIEELIRQREKNIGLASDLKDILNSAIEKDKDWKNNVKNASVSFQEDIIEALGIIGRSKNDTNENYQNALKLVNARINNLESNLHIEIDMERIEDRSKALSYIGIEVADALKLIPKPEETLIEETVEPEETTETEAIQEVEEETPEVKEYMEQTRIDVKPSLWQRVKNSKLVKAIAYALKVKVVIQKPASLPEGRGE